MHELKSLVMMQLKDKIDMSFLKSTKKTIFKVIFSLLKFVIITAIIYLGFYFLTLLRLVSLLPGIPINVLLVIFALMSLLSIIVCTNSLKNNLFKSKDNFMLLTFPVTKTKLFLSKLILFYIYEFFRNIYYILPLFIAYFMINKCAFYFYLWLIIGLVIYTMFIVTISSILSIPAMYIGNLIGRVKGLNVALAAICIGLVVLALIKIILAIPENFDFMASWSTTFWELQDFLNLFSKYAAPFTVLLIAIIGERYGITNSLFTLNQLLYILIILGSIAIVFTLTYFLVRPLFFKLASKEFEYKKKLIKNEHKNKKLNTFWSLFKKEMLVTYRTNEKFNSLMFTAIGLPLAILLLNKIYASMATRLSGTIMTIAFNILLFLLIALASNSNVAKVYSEEGASSYLNKVSPTSYLKILTSKFMLNFIFMTMSILATSIIVATFIGLNLANWLFLFMFVEALYISHLIQSAEMDIMNPQNQEYATTGNHNNNRNIIKSNLLGILLSALFAFFTYFLINENMKTVWVKLMLVAIMYMAFRLYLYISKIKVYYKEK